MHYDAAEEAIFAIYMTPQAKFLELVGYIKGEGKDFPILIESIHQYIEILQKLSTLNQDTQEYLHVKELLYTALNNMTQHISIIHAHSWHIITMLNCLRKNDKRDILSLKLFTPDIEDMEYYTHEDAGDMRTVKSARSRLRAKSYSNAAFHKIYKDNMSTNFSQSIQKLDNLGSILKYNLVTFNKIRNSIIHKDPDLVISVLNENVCGDILKMLEHIKGFVLKYAKDERVLEAIDALNEFSFEDAPEILEHIKDRTKHITPIEAYIEYRKSKYVLPKGKW